MNEEESKTKETLRYLGYTLAVIGGIILVSLLYLFLEPLMELIRVLELIAGIFMFILVVIVAIYYLFFDKNRK